LNILEIIDSIFRSIPYIFETIEHGVPDHF
jgi:hypothetical protein